MSVFNQISAEDLKAHFTHRGWMFGVPVYPGNLGSVSPNVCTRNGVPEFLFDVSEALFFAYCYIASALVPNFVPTIRMSVTGRLDGQPIEMP